MKWGKNKSPIYVTVIIQNKDNKMDGDIQEITDHQLLNFDVIETFGHAPDQVAFSIRNKSGYLVAIY